MIGFRKSFKLAPGYPPHRLTARPVSLRRTPRREGRGKHAAGAPR
jgi:hypothetical protein